MISTRNESILKVDRYKRYNQIRDVLKGHKEGLTAREIAEKLNYIERNATAPRLTELEKMGEVKVIGAKYDCKTNRTVAVYALGVKEND